MGHCSVDQRADVLLGTTCHPNIVSTQSSRASISAGLRRKPAHASEQSLASIVVETISHGRLLPTVQAYSTPLDFLRRSELIE